MKEGWGTLFKEDLHPDRNVLMRASLDNCITVEFLGKCLPRTGDSGLSKTQGEEAVLATLRTMTYA